MRRKIDVTASEMMQLREQGLSNHDIARSLDISINTVRRYIGAQPGRMDNLEAFSDKPLLKKEEKKVEAAVLLPKYAPKPLKELYVIGDVKVTLNHETCMVYIEEQNDDAPLCECMSIPYRDVPDLVQFLAWAMRERMEVSVDVREEQVQE